MAGREAKWKGPVVVLLAAAAAIALLLAWGSRRYDDMMFVPHLGDAGRFRKGLSAMGCPGALDLRLVRVDRDVDGWFAVGDRREAVEVSKSLARGLGAPRAEGNWLIWQTPTHSLMLRADAETELALFQGGPRRPLAETRFRETGR